MAVDTLKKRVILNWKRNVVYVALVERIGLWMATSDPIS